MKRTHNSFIHTDAKRVTTSERIQSLYREARYCSHMYDTTGDPAYRVLSCEYNDTARRMEDAMTRARKIDFLMKLELPKEFLASALAYIRDEKIQDPSMDYTREAEVVARYPTGAQKRVETKSNTGNYGGKNLHGRERRN